MEELRRAIVARTNHSSNPRLTLSRPLSRLPTLLSRYPLLRAPLRFMHRHAIRARPSARKHPFDARMGISAEGYLPWWLLRSDTDADRENQGYAGCQPSCLRRALSQIPNPARFTFVDIGCGKGRSMAVASEFPFSRIVGIELAPALARLARRNMVRMQRRFPNRPPAEVMQGDATRVPLPPGDLVIFLYQPFGRALLKQFIGSITSNRAGHDLFVIYENPQAADLFDAATHFERWHAETVPCDPDERGCAPLDFEDIVTWRWTAAPP